VLWGVTVTETSFSAFPLGFFSESMGILSDERDGRFYQDIFQTKRRYSGKWSLNLLTDYCWSLR
jgi:hypothetical protein